MTQDLVSERYQSAQDVLIDLQRLPKLEGAVPGWISNQSGQSLFTGFCPVYYTLDLLGMKEEPSTT